MTQLIPVTTAPLLDPGQARRDLRLPEGLTLAEIVALAMPGLGAAERGHLRLMLVTPQGSAVIPAQHWHAVRPKPGVHVVIRLIPGDDALRSILAIVVTIAAVAFAGPLAAGLGITGQLGVGLVTAGLSVVGNLLINALIPPPKPKDRENRYQISGWRNQLVPDGAVPVVLGTHRYAPPFAAMSWTEIVGDWQYIRSVFCFGYGPLNLTDFKIGETSLSEYDEVEIEVRDGLPNDLPLSLYPRQIVEETIGAELTRPLPRDDLGEVIDGEPGEETPVVRTTGADASAASVILQFPAGLVRYVGSGKPKHHTVSVRIEQRLVEAEEWLLVATLDITAKKLEAFFRQHTWEFPSRGRWQIRLTMMTDETENSQKQQRVNWAALQMIRPEYPLAFSKPLALVAVRVKATHQLQGALDNFSAVAARPCLDWDHLTEAWVVRETTNPAALYRYVLQSPANPKPVADAGIDLDLLAEWHDFCRIKGLTYSAPLDATDTTLRDILAEIAGAGRATPRHDGLRWGVTIDRPGQLIVDHISPRNSWAFKAKRTYIDPPHAFRVKFRDADNDYQDAERLVRWPGYAGEIDLTEVLDLPGKVDAAEVWREARRRQYEAIHRPDSYEVTQDGPVRVATRGDHVMLSHDVIDQVQKAARVRRVSGQRLEIDDAVEMVEGEVYAIRFRVFADEEDTIGTSVLRSVRTEPGETEILTLEGEGDLPLAGDLVLFGLSETEAYRMVVTGVEAATDMASIMRLVDAAPIIDELLEADVVPAWSSRVGEEIDENLLTPPAPRFTRVASGVDGTDDPDRVDYLVEPGSGAISAASFEVDHRLSGAGSWTTITIPAANGGGAITAYASGDIINLRARARSFTGVAGPYTAEITLTVGAGDADIPAELDASTVTVTALLGGARVQWATGADSAAAAVQVYRSTTSTLDRATDAVGEPVAVSPHQTYQLAVGDTGRGQWVTGGAMTDAGAWTAGTGWAVASGVASHAAGTASALSQAKGVSAGKWYRISFRTTTVTAGNVTAKLAGGTDRPGTTRTTNGLWFDRIQAVTGNNLLSFAASADFAGAIDDVSMYLESAACLNQGTHYFWLEPQNADGVPGPVTGPISITVL